MIEPTFRGEPTEEQKMMEVVAAKCKCGRCTITAEKDDSVQASSDLG
jgi:hypothetical protein